MIRYISKMLLTTQWPNGKAENEGMLKMLRAYLTPVSPLSNAITKSTTAAASKIYTAEMHGRKFETSCTPHAVQLHGSSDYHQTFLFLVRPGRVKIFGRSKRYCVLLSVAEVIVKVSMADILSIWAT